MATIDRGVNTVPEGVAEDVATGVALGLTVGVDALDPDGAVPHEATMRAISAQPVRRITVIF